MTRGGPRQRFQEPQNLERKRTKNAGGGPLIEAFPPAARKAGLSPNGPTHMREMPKVEIGRKLSVGGTIDRHDVSGNMRSLGRVQKDYDLCDLLRQIESVPVDGHFALRDLPDVT